MMLALWFDFWSWAGGQIAASISLAANAVITDGASLQTFSSTLVALGLVTGAQMASQLNANNSAQFAAVLAELIDTHGSIYGVNLPLPLSNHVVTLGGSVFDSLVAIGISTSVALAVANIIQEAAVLGIVTSLTGAEGVNVLQLAFLSAEAIAVVNTLIAELVSAN